MKKKKIVNTKYWGKESELKANLGACIVHALCETKCSHIELENFFLAVQTNYLYMYGNGKVNK